MRMTKILTNFIGVDTEKTCRAAVEAAGSTVVKRRQKGHDAEATLQRAADDVRAEHARLMLAEANDEPYTIDELRHLEAVERNMQFQEKACVNAVAAADRNLAEARLALDAFLTEKSKREASERMCDLAAVITGPLAAAYTAAEASRASAEARGVRDLPYLPVITALLASAAEMTTTPAPKPVVDPLRVVKFLLSNEKYVVGETATFSTPHCVALIANGKAAWLHEDPRQAQLVDAEIKRMAVAAKPRFFESFAIAGSPAPKYLNDRDAAPSSETGPAARADEAA